MKKLEPISIKLGIEPQLYEVEHKTTALIEGRTGRKAYLTLNKGTWLIQERQKDLNRLQKVLKFLKIYKDRYFIRAIRVG